MICDVYCHFGCKWLICSHRRWGWVVVVVRGIVEGGGGRWREGGMEVVVVVSDELALHVTVCFVIHSCKYYVRCIHDIDSVAYWLCMLVMHSDTLHKV